MFYNSLIINVKEYKNKFSKHLDFQKKKQNGDRKQLEIEIDNHN